jgi:hypothetical protein
MLFTIRTRRTRDGIAEAAALDLKDGVKTPTWLCEVIR